MNKIYSTFIEQGEAGRVVRLSDVTEAFRKDPESLPFTLVFTLFDGSLRRFDYRLSRWTDAGERRFALGYITAVIGNRLSALGGRSLRITLPKDEPEVAALFREAERVLRSGDGHTKALRVIDRINRGAGREPFSITIEEGEVPAAGMDSSASGMGVSAAGMGSSVSGADGQGAGVDAQGSGADAPASGSAEGAATGQTPIPLGERLRQTVLRAETGVRMGIDIGGTDIKAVVYRDGKLIAVKEFDWDPGRAERAEEITDPILLIAKLLKAAVALDENPCPDIGLFLTEALKKDALLPQMALVMSLAEAACPKDAGLMDSIGVSFPDVVLNDRICGGETPKTRGIREARPESYEEEFARLRGLNEELGALLKPGGSVRMTNDGNMAAYTAAVELAHGDAPASLDGGVFAHSLGTDLGTGWLLPDGRFPDMPLECYDFCADLGSFPALGYPAADLRSTRNGNTNLPGAQRYLGQSAAFRLLWDRAPELMRAYTQGKNGYPEVRTDPEDLRKPLLAHIMALADAGNPDAEAVFRQIGENLGALSREIDAVLRPETDTRLLFGRVIKSPRCFELIGEGCAKAFPGLKLAAADESLAHTSLMRALAARPGVTVAQFGQAVGAAVFGAEGEWDMRSEYDVSALNPRRNPYVNKPADA